MAGSQGWCFTLCDWFIAEFQLNGAQKYDDFLFLQALPPTWEGLGGLPTSEFPDVGKVFWPLLLSQLSTPLPALPCTCNQQ